MGGGLEEDRTTISKVPDIICKRRNSLQFQEEDLQQKHLPMIHSRHEV